ncbi:MAG: hypothetical protein JO041_10365 [Acidobacteria bacterium]|nr:hypothetical protein [Acidobacteriota bacterium]
MSLLNLSAYTADPGDIWTPKTSFMVSDPFAIVLNVQADSSVVNEGLLFDALFQIVNPQEDPYEGAWWTVPSGGNVMTMNSVDFPWNGADFQLGTNFALGLTWSHYSDAVSQINGPSITGVYYVQGSINVEDSDLFATSGPFWFKSR